MRISGKYSYVDGFPCTQGWQASAISSVQRYSASCSPGGTSAVEGVVNWSGSISGVGYLPPMPTGDDIPFIGVASAAAAHKVNYEGTIQITETVIRIPVSSGNVITWTSNFGVQGELTKTTATAYSDDTREAGASGKNGEIRVESVLDADTFTAVDEVQDITLTFRRPAVESTSSGLIYRDAGNLEADISFQVNSDDLENALHLPNNFNRVRAYVTPSLFYMFDSILWSGLSNFQVQRDPLQIVGYQVNGMWTALRERSPAALGEILLPGGDEFYAEGET
jgi:hypothetical protein